MKRHFGVQKPYFCIVLFFTALILIGSLGIASISFGQFFSEEPLAILGKGKIVSFSPMESLLPLRRLTGEK